MNKIVAGVLLIAVLLAGIFLYQKYRIAPHIKFDSLELTDLNGQPVNLQSYKGKKLFINFFATWCGPCVGELPSLDRASETLHADSFVFISISDEPVALLKRFAYRMNTANIIYLHSVSKLHGLDVYTVPTNYILNDKGEVVFQKTGEQNWDEPETIAEIRKKAD